MGMHDIELFKRNLIEKFLIDFIIGNSFQIGIIFCFVLMYITSIQSIGIFSNLLIVCKMLMVLPVDVISEEPHFSKNTSGIPQKISYSLFYVIALMSRELFFNVKKRFVVLSLLILYLSPPR